MELGRDGGGGGYYYEWTAVVNATHWLDANEHSKGTLGDVGTIC